jgi:hypothetical protein
MITTHHPEGSTMNIEYANTIPLREILSKLKIALRFTDEHILMYSSPFSEEDCEHLVVNTETNTWWDEALKRGGKPICLVMEWLRNAKQKHTAADALRWMQKQLGYRTLELPSDMLRLWEEDSNYIVTDVSYIASGFLIAYLEDVRAIPVSTALPFVKEVVVVNKKTGNELKALAVENEDGGFTIRNLYIKGNVRPDDITFVRGKVVKPETVHIFKDMFDYLSAVHYNKDQPFHGDTIILNSVNNVPKSSAYIRHYGYRKCYTWLDNSAEGNRLTGIYNKFLRSEPNLTHYKMNKLYEGFKDVNAWLVDLTSTKSGE